MFNPFSTSLNEIDTQNINSLIDALDKKSEKIQEDAFVQLLNLPIPKNYITVLLLKIKKYLESTNKKLQLNAIALLKKITLNYTELVEQEMKLLKMDFIYICVMHNFVSKRIVFIIYTYKIINNILYINNRFDLLILKYLIDYKKSVDHVGKVKFIIQLNYDIFLKDYSLVYDIVSTLDKNTAVFEIFYNYIKTLNNNPDIKVFLILKIFYNVKKELNCIENELYNNAIAFNNETLNLIKNIPIIDKKQILATNYEQCQILGLESDENYILKIFNNNFNIFEILLHIKHPNQFIEQLILSKKYQLELSINNFYHYILNINFSKDIYKLLIKLNINDEAQLYLNYKQNIISNHVYSNDCLINNFHIAEKVCNPTIILNLLKHTNVYSLDITNFINNNEVLFETNFDLLKEFVVNYKKINLTDFTLLKKLFIYHITTNKKIVEIIKNNIHSILKECNYTVIILILEYLFIDNISFSSKNINFDFILNTELNAELLIKIFTSITDIETGIENFIQSTIKYLDNYKIPNTIYLNSRVFDITQYFYDGILELPIKDKKIQILKDILLLINNNNNNNTKITILLQICNLLLYEKYVLIDNIHEISFKHNIILLDQITNSIIKKEMIIDKIKSLTFSHIKNNNIYVNISCNPRLLDTLIRHEEIIVMGVLDPTFISNESLKIIIHNILNMNPTNTIYIDNNCVVFNTPIDMISMIEHDKNLLIKQFRLERLTIYQPLIDKISDFVSNLIIDNYSFSKQEYNIEKSLLFNFLLDFLNDFITSYFIILVPALIKTKNIWLIDFIEDNLDKNKLQIFGEICTEKELNEFAYIFPRTFRKYFINIYDTQMFTKIFINFIKSKSLPDNCVLNIIESTQHINFKYIYEIDSVKQELSIKMYKNLLKTPEIEENCLKLYILLKKTYMIPEIFNIWKSNYDKKLLGYSECLICFFIIDPEYKTYPDFLCNNCNNKFHKSCIHKWIGQSKTEKCPMCRMSLMLIKKNAL